MNELIEALMIAAHRMGGRTELCKAAGISPSMLSSVMTRKKLCPAKLAAVVGFTVAKVVHYECKRVAPLDALVPPVRERSEPEGPRPARARGRSPESAVRKDAPNTNH